MDSPKKERPFLRELTSWPRSLLKAFADAGQGRAQRKKEYWSFALPRGAGTAEFHYRSPRCGFPELWSNRGSWAARLEASTRQ